MQQFQIYMSAKSFAEIFTETINLHGYSLGQICVNLKNRGIRVNKSTLMRWRDGQTHPSFDNIETIRYLPRALGLSDSEARHFLDEVSQALGFNIAVQKIYSTDNSPIRYRKHLGSDVLSAFAGRQKELSTLLEQVSIRHSVMITGLGGVGKTRLAQELLQRSLTQFAHGCEYLEISPGQTSLHVLRNVAFLLGMNLSADALNETSRDLIREKIRLHTSGISLIFLVDNVENAEQVRDLVRALPEIVWVFTSRRTSLKSVSVSGLNLEPPPAADAVQIFRTFAHTAVMQHGDLEKIVDALGRLPLALRMTASLLENGIVSNSQELCDWLVQKGLMGSRSFAFNLRILFDQLLENVPADARTIFEICGAFTNPIIRLSHIQAILKKMDIKPAPEAWSALGDFSLVNFPDGTSIELHRLVHEYARLRWLNSPKFAVIWEQFKSTYLEIAENQASNSDESQRSYRLFLPDEANLLRVVDDFYQNSDWVSLGRMGPVLGGYFWQSSNYAGYEKVEMMCLHASQKTGDRLWEAKTYAELGFMKMEQGNWLQAEDFMLQSQTISDSLPEQRFTQARIRRYRSLLALARGDLEQAIKLQDDVELRLAQLTNPPETQLDVAWFWLRTTRMDAYYRKGNLVQAKNQGEMAEKLLQKINQTGNYRGRDFGVIFGDVHFGLGNIEAALNIWEKMLLFEDGLPLQVEEADVLSRLGWVKIQREEIEESMAYLNKAISHKLSILTSCQEWTQWAS